jgi:cell division cycle protein 20 (cofactor of APC complex)
MWLTLFLAAADESLKFWKLFEKKPGAPSVAAQSAMSGKNGDMVKQMTIR